MSEMTLVDRVRQLDPAQRTQFVQKFYSQRLEALRDTSRTSAPQLSPAQLRLWYLAQTDEADSSYNIPGFFRIRGDVDVDQLRAAIVTIAERHEILRSSIVGDPPTLVVHQAVATEIDVLAAPEGASNDEWAQHRAAEFLRRPFFLDDAPLWRIQIITENGQPKYLTGSFHHLIFDGWSLTVFVRELLTLLAEKAVEPLAWQYPDYAQFAHGRQELQRQITAFEREEAGLTEHETFWCDYLRDLPDPLDLRGTASPATASNDGKLLVAKIPGEIWNQLVEIAREENATPFAAALAMYNALLFRRSQQNDIIVGTPVNGRGDIETHPLIGTFVNTLPIRTCVDATMTVRDLIRASSGTGMEALDHDDVLFDRIVELVNPDRRGGIHPIFQTLFSFQPAIGNLENDDVAMEYVDLDFGTAKFDLSLDMIDDLDGVRLVFEYRTDLFSDRAISELADSMLALAEHMAASPDVTLGQLAIVTPQARERLLTMGASPEAEPQWKSVMDAFVANAALHPEAAAVSDANGTHSYGSLDKRSDEVRDKLAAAQLPTGVIAILLPRGTELFASILGVWKYGATPLVLDPSLPITRMQTMVDDAHAAVVTERLHLMETSDLRPATGSPVVLAEIEATKPTATVDRVADDAYIVYTSGSTGMPKGIAVSNHAYTRMAASWMAEFDLDQPRMLQIAASSFDVFYGDIARAFSSGGHLRIVSSETAATPSLLAQMLVEEPADFVEFVPSIFRRLATHLRRKGQRIDVCTLVIASEGWSMSEAREWNQDILGPNTQMYNTYGVAEATIDSTVHRVNIHSSRDGSSSVPIGRALPNVTLFVVDEWLGLVPANTPGEILIGGHGANTRYIGGAATNNDRFLTLTVNGESVRVYRTGDFAHWDEEGQLVFLGRRDNQVKLRGVRIELSEVDDAVRRLPGVREAATVVTGQGAGQRLATWTVADSAAVDLEQWRRTLLRALPTAMVPEVVITNELPMLASGKIDFKQLKRWELPVRTNHHIAPRTDAEERMSALFQEILDVDALSIDDSFFTLGGHSLNALELISRIQSEFEVKLKIAELFDHPTVADLTARVADRTDPAELTTTPTVEPDPAHRWDEFPLTDVQQAYWLGRDSAFEFSGVSTHSYDEFHGDGLDVDRFTDALNTIITRHDMMRCIIVDHTAQRVLKEVPRYSPTVYDLSLANQAEIDASLEAVRDEMSHQQLDVTQWPTFDIRVSVLPGHQLILHLSTDALLLDATSFVTVVKEISQAYEGMPLKSTDFSFRDYVLAEQRYESSPEFAQAEAYWLDRLPGIHAAPELPMRAHPDDLVDPRFTRLHARMEKERWETLKRAAAARGITASSLCLSAYAQVLATRAKQAQFSINLTFLSRKPFHPDVNEVVGEFTSVTLLPIDLTSDPAFLDSATTIQRDLWEALGHNQMSGVKVQRAYAKYHHSPASAHFPVVFTSTLGGIPMPDDSFPMRHQPEYGVTQTSQVWLDSGIWEDQRGDLRCNWDVVLEVYPEGFVEAMFKDWITLLHDLAEDPDAWQRSRPYTVPEPLEIVDAPRDTLLSNVVSQAKSRPEAVAVVDPRRTMSYRQICDAAGSVATWLREQEVQAGELVAIIMSPGWEQTVAALGTVAVGAYLPINPAMPADRIRGILDQASVRCLLTQPQHNAMVESLGNYQTLTVTEHLGDAVDGLTVLESSTAEPDDLAYVIFTSGSTGRPKGVMITHAAALNTILDVNERYRVGPQDRVFAISDLGFDLSVYDIFGMLSAGGALVVPDVAKRLDPIAQHELILEHRVTLWNSVPALFQLYLGAVDERKSSLRLVMMSGDWIPLALPDRARELLPGVELHSLGGATEASIWSITYPIHEVRPEWTSIPYGKGMKNQDLVVLDSDLRECNEWVTGDLYIRGVGLALGYWRDEAETNAAFVKHPRSGEALYRTGDLGRRMSDGNIEFLGRSDFQMKINGYRVEAGEVERSMVAHPAVARAAVVSYGVGLGDKRLACVWTKESACGVTPSDEELTEFLSTRLQSYMVPSAYLEVDEIPLSGNGKVDQKAINLMLKHLDKPTAPFVAAAASDEQDLIKIWSHVLGRTSVGMYDDFFQTGGTSIDAIELVTQLRKQFNTEIQLSDLYTRTTPRELVDRIREMTTA